MTDLPNYRYRGARAMVLLHERQMREFLETWREFRRSGLPLPETDDPDYDSVESVLRHVLRAARGYMVWMCRQLDLPDPGIRPAPEPAEVEDQAAPYLDHVLDRWRQPLADVPEERFGDTTYMSGWQVPYCIDAMLEHAVMHPMRHTFQLRELLRNAR